MPGAPHGAIRHPIQHWKRRVLKRQPKLPASPALPCPALDPRHITLTSPYLTSSPPILPAAIAWALELDDTNPVHVNEGV